ncbi:MAG TPA: dihydropteroate synthase [Egibacteraceae bacterium]|jgi:dihydropteroate synthase|nr:dihydropteroate synthase [Egibacteraceae bacterium]
MRFRLRSTTFRLDERAAVMAIVNRTPDSFSDRGRGWALGAALDLAAAHVAAGADIVDVGGVKAGPGADVGVEEERARVLPFVEAFRARWDVPLSVDTFRAAVAADALDAGADLVNDSTGLTDPELAGVVAARPRAALVVVHSGTPPRTRPFRTTYRPDVTTVVVNGLARLTEEARRRGVARDRIVVDPGHDFGKNTAHSLELTRRLPEIRALGYPVLVAMSNKDFLGETLDLPVDERAEASLAAAVTAVHLGAHVVRVHDTRATVRAVRTMETILGRRRPAVSARGLD